MGSIDHVDVVGPISYGQSDGSFAVLLDQVDYLCLLLRRDPAGDDHFTPIGQAGQLSPHLLPFIRGRTLSAVATATSRLQQQFGSGAGQISLEGSIALLQPLDLALAVRCRGHQRQHDNRGQQGAPAPPPPGLVLSLRLRC